ncbi:NmrA family NAD(P)-binding protein [Mycoplana azooxidifex]|uniref:NmrA family NAD(P)-binding protein n=1 Tax=Mycoplana azooxidifex TaxID=1636188 RepID=UPI00160D4869|nr:NmrA family NAD(P)-binding protein [Mycoplana azooxidifex]
MSRLLVLVIGATGSVGRLVDDEALRAGHRVRALVRTSGRTAWADGVAEARFFSVSRRFPRGSLSAPRSACALPFILATTF